MIVVNKYKQDYTHYIGRPSVFGNPFVIGVDGDRDEVCDRYAEYAKSNPKLMVAIRALPPDAILGCFCHPLRCHGDEIIKIFKALARKVT